MSKKKPEVTSEERELFRKTVRSTPVDDQNETFEEEANLTREDFTFLSASILDKLSPDDWLSAEDSIHFARTGIPDRKLSQLKRGQLLKEARLDLHGLTGDEALATTSQFLHACAKQGVSVVLIVHGKGGYAGNKKPVLKNLLNLWLREQPEVLAFYSAKQRDGGSGAIYLLIKR